MSKKSPLSILCIEDEDEIRSNYVEFLKTRYENVYEAADGESAYKIYLEKKPSIMLVDINIPKLNGIELITKIRELDHTTKIIVLTAQDDVNTLMQATSLKLTQYLVKPISRKAFKDVLALTHEEIQNFQTASLAILRLPNNYIYHIDQRILYHDTEEVPLTQHEQKLFHTLATNLNKAVSYNTLIENIWEDYYEYKIDSLKTLVKNLRKKFPVGTIENIFGFGYKM